MNSFQPKNSIQSMANSKNVDEKEQKQIANGISNFFANHDTFENNIELFDLIDAEISDSKNTVYFNKSKCRFFIKKTYRDFKQNKNIFIHEQAIYNRAKDLSPYLVCSLDTSDKNTVLKKVKMPFYPGINLDYSMVMHQNDNALSPTPTDIQVWMYEVASAFKVLHENNFFHGFFSTDCVFLKDDMNVAIGNFANTMRDFSEYKKYVYFRAPELFTKAKDEILNCFNGNISKEDLIMMKAADVYSYGIFINQLITNEDPESSMKQITNFHNASIISVLQRENAQIQYPHRSVESNNFQLIDQCLKINPNERITFDQICNMLINTFWSKEVNKNEFYERIGNQNNERYSCDLYSFLTFFRNVSQLPESHYGLKAIMKLKKKLLKLTDDENELKFLQEIIDIGSGANIQKCYNQIISFISENKFFINELNKRIKKEARIQLSQDLPRQNLTNEKINNFLGEIFQVHLINKNNIQEYSSNLFLLYDKFKKYVSEKINSQKKITPNNEQILKEDQKPAEFYNFAHESYQRILSQRKNQFKRPIENSLKLSDLTCHTIGQIVTRKIKSGHPNSNYKLTFELSNQDPNQIKYDIQYIKETLHNLDIDYHNVSTSGKSKIIVTINAPSLD